MTRDLNPKSRLWMLFDRRRIHHLRQKTGGKGKGVILKFGEREKTLRIRYNYQVPTD